ncbi:MAG: ABC transporter permease [Bryobacteraceae bacterium]
MLHDLYCRVRSLVRRKAIETELDDELGFHREQQLKKYLNSGLSEEDAMRRVQMEFGGLDQVKEECRDARGIQLMDTLFRDIRYALRVLLKSPGFTLVATLTLALGIGANTAIFSLVYGVLLRPLPYEDAARLIVLNETTPKVGMVSPSYLDFLDWRAQSRAFLNMAVVNDVGFNLSGIDRPENISGKAVSPNFLSVLGVRPLFGRDFDPSEEKVGTAPVVLLNYTLWQSHFGGDRKVIGRTIALNDRSFVIIGVLPPQFRWVEKTEVLEPIGVWMTNNSAYGERGERGDSAVLGRLAPGVDFTRAQAEMQGIAARLAQAYPGTNDQFGVALRPIRDVFVHEIRPVVMVLFAAVTFVLLIACANVASLFLMRGAARRREMSLRIAIGASRGRILAQTLAESFTLTFLGGLAGLALAVAVIHGAAGLIPDEMLAGANVDLNGAVLLFTAGVVTLAAFAFALGPALQSTRAAVHSELKEGGRGTTAGAGTNRWRRILVVAEISLALILLIGAGLLMKSIHRLLSVDAGVRTERVLTMQLSLRTERYAKNPSILNFWDHVLGGVRALPGIQSAALGTGVPLTDDHSRTDITIEGMALPKPGGYPHPDVHIVSSDYAGTLGVQLKRGREFTLMDNENAPRVAMVNERVARQLFPKSDPVGKRFMFGHPSATHTSTWVTIVGVLGDTKLYGLANPSRLEVYVPFHQAVPGSMTLIAKSVTDAAALVSGIRGVIASVDKDQPEFGIATMEQLVRDSVSTRRITFTILGAFSALALVLAAIGVYGVISYSAAQRAHEIAIRMALGAKPKDVLRMLIAQGAKIVGAGVLIGTVASLGLTRLMSNLLFSVSSTDPATLLGVAGVIALVAMLACYIPARRTLRVDPMAALRSE